MKWNTILFVIILSSAPLLRAQGAGSSGAAPFPDTGPFRVREQFLIGMGYLALDPGSAVVLDRGKVRIDVVHSQTNTFARSESVIQLLDSGTERADLGTADLHALADSGEGPAFLVDGELARTSIALRRGVGRGLEASVTIPVLEFGGGTLDGFVEAFHGAFGLGQGGRTGARRNDSNVFFRDASGREIAPEVRPGAGLGDVALALKKQIPLRGRGWTVAVEGVMELPTGSEQHLSSNAGIDLGTQVLVTKTFAHACLHGSAGLVFASESEVLGTDAQLLGTLTLGWEQMIGVRSSAVAQVTASQSPFGRLDIEGLSADAYLLNVGVKHQIASGAVAFVAVSENLVHYDSSADVGFHVGITLTR